MSDPLDHLLSVDLGESSPLCDVFEGERKSVALSKSKKPVKKVRFADACLQNFGDVALRKLSSIDKSEGPGSKSNSKEVKGILKVIKPSNSERYGKFKGWAKPSPSVPVTIKIVSNIEDDNYVEDETSTSSKSVKESVATMNEDSVPSEILDAIPKNDESEVHILHQNSPTCVIDDQRKPVHLQDVERCMVEAGSNSELHLGDFATSQIGEQVFDELNGDVQSPCVKKNEHNFDSGKALVDEIRQISKELFVKSASHLEDAESNGLDGNVESEALPDGNFISTDIVNDILDTQHGRERLLLQKIENSELSAEACKTPGKKLVSDDMQQNAETFALKLDSSSRIRRPSSPHTWKLKRVLEEIAPEKPTAKDLRTIAFSAWCAIKADEKKSLVKKLKNAEKQTQELIIKEKSLKEASAIKAFLCWKEQKEKFIKLKKENEMKVTETKLSKAQEDKKKQKEDADLVFRAWKKRKDEELKEQLRKQKLKTKKETMNKGQSEEMKKLDATAAFNAWKSQKLMEFQRKEKECLVQKELETSLQTKERSERDKEALKAYEVWLEYKELYEDRYDWRNQFESKPPWSPPGRIA